MTTEPENEKYTTASGYCYGDRVLYADPHFFVPLWQELYDSHMKLWKFYEVASQLIDVPGIGPQNVPGADMEEIWDVRNNHATFATENPKTLVANENAPAEYRDIPRFTTPPGLNLIMRSDPIRMVLNPNARRADPRATRADRSSFS